MSSLQRYEGYLLTDHRAGGGIPGTRYDTPLMEEATLWCSHCTGVQVKNPNRIRPRPYCKKCDCYICDGCDYFRSQPDYIHRSFAEIRDLVTSGQAELVGPIGDPKSLIFKSLIIKV